ncbi:NUDIX hydrolase [Hathewaya limosa]|uniref:ADP-ribose pyrophosphatase YjhB (NUDIX family) n=1 Tax=Hathewaya limosa TaxID=1536 RepID=A0ABU0JT37_HATLI|nr:NUDIX hydrolase [Hathewaya limosa]MDQ0480257.1 ADP-ribose pyrophosphatase YjhB (NUDIX family) [Hathewaya limosa]
MIVIKEDGIRFNYRNVGIAIKDNKVLLHKPEEYEFWALPEGRCELLETSIETIKREFLEELGEEITVEKLVWVVENFFEIKNEKYHEISMYYMIKFCDESEIYKHKEIKGIEDDKKLIFKWFDINELEKQPIQPTFIKDELKCISDNIKHIIHKEI